MFSIQSVFRKQLPPSLNIMIHNTVQFTQRLSKNTVCCFWPRHNVTNENSGFRLTLNQHWRACLSSWRNAHARSARLSCTRPIGARRVTSSEVPPTRRAVIEEEGDVQFQSNMVCVGKIKGQDINTMKDDYFERLSRSSKNIDGCAIFCEL